MGLTFDISFSPSGFFNIGTIIDFFPDCGILRNRRQVLNNNVTAHFTDSFCSTHTLHTPALTLSIPGATIYLHEPHTVATSSSVVSHINSLYQLPFTFFFGFSYTSSYQVGLTISDFSSGQSNTAAN